MPLGDASVRDLVGRVADRLTEPVGPGPYTVRSDHAKHTGAAPGVILAGVDVFVETDRLVLRRFRADDLDLIVELDSDPAVKRYIDNGAPVDREDLAETLDWWLGYYHRSEGYGFWAAVEKATGRFLGWFHLRPGAGAGPSEPEIGYRLRRDSWGQGYGTEGSRALVDKAFADLGADRVYATTMAVNVGSRRVMEKAGLRFVRTFRADWPVSIPGDEEGDVEYAIDRAQWEADRAASADRASASEASPQ